MKKLNIELINNNSTSPNDGLIYWEESEIYANTIRRNLTGDLDVDLYVKTWSSPQKHYLIACKNVPNAFGNYINADVAWFQCQGGKLFIHRSHENSNPIIIQAKSFELFELEQNELLK